jgi:hypothetical protein
MNQRYYDRKKKGDVDDAAIQQSELMQEVANQVEKPTWVERGRRQRGEKASERERARESEI